MAINMYQAYAGQPIRTSTVGDSSSNKGRSSDSAGPVSAPESAQTDSASDVVGSLGPESGLAASAKAAVDPAQVTRAVEQANAISETTLRARNRSVEFQYDDGSGRVTMTITEERNGEQVSRQIPPDEFLALAERLKEYADDGSGYPPGMLFSSDG